MKAELSREQKIDGLVIIGWTFAVLAYFLPKLLAQTNLPHSLIFYGEAAQLSIPFWKFCAGMLKHGLMPLWSPHFFCGYPFLAFPWNNLYYPPFYLLINFSYFNALYIDSICGFILAGYFSYFCFRRINLSPCASLAGMLAIVTGGYFTHYSTYYYCYREWYFALTCWSLAGLIYQCPRLKYFLGLVLGTGLSMTLDVETSYYLVWFCLGWVLYSAPAGERFKRFFLVGLAMGIGFVLLGAPPIINTTAFFTQSIRSQGITFSGFLINRLAWQGLFLGFIPVEMPMINQIFHYYLGWSVCVLMIFGILRLRKKAIGSVIAIILYTLYTMGEPHFLKIFYHLPVFSRSILHYGAAVVIFMILAGWAAFGMQEIISKPVTRKFVLFISFLILALLAIEVIDFRVARMNLLLLKGIPLSQAWLHSLSWHWFRLPFLALLFCAGLFLAIRKSAISKQSLGVFLIVFIILDLSCFTLSTRPSSRRELLEPGPELQSIMLGNDFNRFWPVTQKNLEDPELVAMMGMQLDPLITGSHTPLGYMRLLPRRVTNIINLIAPGYILYDRSGKLERLEPTHPLEIKKIDAKTASILSMLNVGTVISHGIKLQTDWPMTERGEFMLYKNPGVLPRAFLVGDIIKVKSDPDQLNLISTPGFDFAQKAIVGEEFSSDIKGDPSGSLRLLNFRPGYWDWESNVPGPGNELLFLSENYYPGWRAFQDGVEKNIYRVNYAFMGLAVPAGKHRVELRFEPTAFHVGLWTGLSTYFSLLVLLLIVFLRRDKGAAKVSHG